MPQISTDVRAVLSAAIIEGNSLTLQGQLERKLYTETNKVIEAAGGKWNRKAGAHIFAEDALDVIEPILLTGEYRRVKQDFGQFDTPDEVGNFVIDLSLIQRGMSVLEPSAGIGNLARLAVDAGGLVTAYEIDPKRASQLGGLEIDAIEVRRADFLTVGAAWIYDRVVMNPPFARQADIDHVRHAIGFLKPGGVLVSVMSAGVRFRVDRKATEFRDFVAAHDGEYYDVPAGSFKASGTMVETCIVRLFT